MESNIGIYAAINAVQTDLNKEGITKNRKNQAQNYNFRGIDDVYNALSPLLAKHGLCILPRILMRTCDERQTKNGGSMFYVTVEAEFDFVCAKDGSKHIVRTFGEAMDSADKATNKAMSAAYKYAAFQAFAIPTEGDNDADAHTPTPAPRQAATPTPAPAPKPTPVPNEPMMTDQQRKILMMIYGDAPREIRLEDANEHFQRAKPGCQIIKSFSEMTAKQAAWLIQTISPMPREAANG